MTELSQFAKRYSEFYYPLEEFVFSRDGTPVVFNTNNTGDVFISSDDGGLDEYREVSFKISDHVFASGEGINALPTFNRQPHDGSPNYSLIGDRYTGDPMPIYDGDVYGDSVTVDADGSDEQTEHPFAVSDHVLYNFTNSVFTFNRENVLTAIDLKKESNRVIWQRSHKGSNAFKSRRGPPAIYKRDGQPDLFCITPSGNLDNSLAIYDTSNGDIVGLYSTQNQYGEFISADHATFIMGNKLYIFGDKVVEFDLDLLAFTGISGQSYKLIGSVSYSEQLNAVIGQNEKAVSVQKDPDGGLDLSTVSQLWDNSGQRNTQTDGAPIIYEDINRVVNNVEAKIFCHAIREDTDSGLNAGEQAWTYQSDFYEGKMASTTGETDLYVAPSNSGRHERLEIHPDQTPTVVWSESSPIGLSEGRGSCSVNQNLAYFCDKQGGTIRRKSDGSIVDFYDDVQFGQSGDSQMIYKGGIILLANSIDSQSSVYIFNYIVEDRLTDYY